MSNNLLTLSIINKDLGENVDNLVMKCREYIEVLLKQKHDIINKIKSQIINEKSDIKKLFDEVHIKRLEIIALREKIAQLKLKYADFKKETENMIIFQNLMKDLKYNCNRFVYFTCIQCISSKSNKMKTNLLKNHDKETFMTYTILCKLSVAISNTQCQNLVSYISKLINYWYCILERYYSEDFRILLNQINWPFIMTKSVDNTKLDNFKQKFQYLADMLLKIKLLKNDDIEFDKEQTTPYLMRHFTYINLPIYLLIIPFRKRFMFHFTGNKLTNVVNKPEWYLSKVLSWIRDYRMFVLEWLGPIYKENGKNLVDSQHEFILGLLQCIVIKLEADLSNFQIEDMVFSHIVDEILSFEHELKQTFGYSVDYPNVTEVLTLPHIFLKWINIEKTYANSKMNLILQNKDQWKILVTDKRYCHISGADEFLTLIRTMSDRYSILCQPRHKLQFLKLQINLLEEFQEKIIDVTNDTNNSNEYLIHMLCALHYIVITLNNWGYNMHFLSLLNYKCELSRSSSINVNENEETVFDDLINLYNLKMNLIINILCDNIMAKIKINSKPYKRDKWHIMNLSNDNKFCITESGWIVFELFTENLNTLNKTLPVSLFNRCWPILVTKFATFIFDDILMDNMFNYGGAQHLFGDIKYKFIPIISKYTIKPTLYIEKLLEACNVLCCQPNFKPVFLTKHEASEISLRRIDIGNLI